VAIQTSIIQIQPTFFMLLVEQIIFLKMLMYLNQNFNKTIVFESFNFLN